MTLALPRALAPWGPALAEMPEPRVRALWPLLQRLDAAIGPLRPRPHGGDGDPDGFDGLDRRGSYERLLTTEWLLADEIPEEFLRRAGSAEHTFLRLARPEQSASRVVCALFDAGSDQLGAPRLVHLAALLVLGRRAVAGDADFRWGVWQQRTLRDDLTPAAVKALLQARTARRVDAEDMAQWQERLRALGTSVETWTIGRPLPGIAGGLVAPEESLETERRVVRVEVRPPGGAARRLELPLPDDRASVPLLRDPYETAAPPAKPRDLRPELRPTSNLVITMDGQFVLARTACGGIGGWRIPPSPRAVPARPKRWTVATKDPVLFAGMDRRRPVLVTGRSGSDPTIRTELRVHRLGRHGALVAGEELVSGHQQLHGYVGAPLGLWISGAEKPSVLTYDGRLLEADGGRLLSSLWDDGDVVIAVMRGAAAAMTAPDLAGGVRGLTFTRYGAIGTWVAPRERAGFAGWSGDPRGVLALRTDDRQGAWTFIRHGHPYVTLTASGMVRGCTYSSRKNEPALVVRGDDPRTLYLQFANHRRHLPTAATPITHVTCSPAAPVIAWCSAEGELGIWSVRHEAMLLHHIPESS